VVSFPQVSPPEPCAPLSPAPYAPHAPPISFFTASCVTDYKVMLIAFDFQFSYLILYPHSSEPGGTLAETRGTLVLVYRGTPGESHWFRDLTEYENVL